MNELELLKPVRLGDSGFDVKRVQEWLTLGGFGLRIDGQFGPATGSAVNQYQASLGDPQTSVVTPDLFASLVAPMKAALAPIDPTGQSPGTLTVAYAEQHLAQRPREVGGNNCGPWVRLYMGGHDGVEWRWCAGFACFCLGQAAQSLSVAPPIAPSYSCTRLGDQAKASGLFLDGGRVQTRQQLTPGSFFLVRGSSEEWSHTGLVRAVADDSFTTIEGNSNETGGSDGYEVCSNTRGYADSHGAPRDFILIT